MSLDVCAIHITKKKIRKKMFSSPELYALLLLSLSEIYFV